MKQQSEQEVLHKAAAYCSAAERCTQDVLKKIEPSGLSAEENERIIARLIKEKFINESRYARCFVNDKIRFNKWGRIKIDYELRQKKIASDIRNEALNNIDETDYNNTLYNLLKDKKKTIKAKDSRDEYYKLMRFAAGRGFESNICSRCLKKLLNGTGYDDME